MDELTLWTEVFRYTRWGHGRAWGVGEVGSQESKAEYRPEERGVVKANCCDWIFEVYVGNQGATSSGQIAWEI